MKLLRAALPLLLPLIGFSSAASDCATWERLYAGEEAWGLGAAGRACAAAAWAAGAQAWAPPSRWQLFNVLCRGACRDLAGRLARVAALDAVTNCTCAATVTRACPRSPAALLCAQGGGGGACLSEAAVAAWCDAGACGRFAGDEAAWRQQTAACGAGGG